MANNDAAFGLKPYNTPFGALKTMMVTITAGTTKIFRGDPMKQEAAGTHGVASAGDMFSGIVLALYDSNGYPVKYYPGDSSAGYKALICFDPEQLFLCQEDSVTSTLALADRGLNCDLVAGTGDETTGESRWEIDSDSADTTATLQVRLIDLYNHPDNAVGDNAIWIVKPNYHQYAQTTGV